MTHRFLDPSAFPEIISEMIQSKHTPKLHTHINCDEPYRNLMVRIARASELGGARFDSNHVMASRDSGH